MPRQTLTVSSRGQITLPAGLRKRLGIRPGGVLSAEEKGGELVLRPAIVLEMEPYSDADIRRWDEEDRLSPGERDRILKLLGAGR
ncbi:AbrB/MazE/SpoVT family DNA-binding domain-containing protein [Candidatus Deferrimicrobium sp.]|uniref:AbrB/MazE/SpoVT family DNA-binding domain-containing protein n=1 Tax=Candidatus Deferrimicrobium sp. TaxID=3060586 RepID=UPI0027198F6E|nr:AbrB/MazE/SpoVT family DNA-binding domain-containing protein [Candidatus Deferrimicrobium sp.]MDO8739147.1 AbrB/MazE/SpoVT family DNA-binding domain-containing protein [Candidatus Deferrimicrobium sp.]